MKGLPFFRSYKWIYPTYPCPFWVPLSDDGSDDEVGDPDRERAQEHLVGDVKQALDLAE
jgi:hypothetical protein